MSHPPQLLELVPLMRPDNAGSQASIKQSDYALTGIRVLDLSTVLAGPFCTQILGDLGAEIIKIESPLGDPTRRFGPYFYNGESAYFLSINRNKKSVVLDLKSPAGHKAMMDLVTHSDVVFDNFRPGVTARLGLSERELREINPKVVTCSVSGFGTSGPLSPRPAFDIVVQAMGGGMALTGPEEGEPMLMGLPVGDCLAGMFAAQGILAALLERERAGRGRHVEVSMLNSQVALLSCYASYYFASDTVPPRFGTRHPQNVPARVFRAKDGFIAVYAALDEFFQKLCEALSRLDLPADPRFADANARRTHSRALDRELEPSLALFTVAELDERLSIAGVPVGPVYDMSQILNHPHILGQDMVMELAHPTAGIVKTTGNPIKVGDDVTPRTPPPLFGQHTREVLGEIAGYSEADVDQLIEQGAARAHSGS